MADLTADQFRQDFQEFGDNNIFPDSTINFYINLAKLMVDPKQRMGDMLVPMQELFVAHNVAIEAMAQKTTAVGGIPGLSKGAISSESPGAVSVSYDTNSTLELNAGHWNLTVYGTRFIRTARLFGQGPIQVSPSGGCGASAWSGPPTGFGGF